jgi:hypothetical protein
MDQRAALTQHWPLFGLEFGFPALGGDAVP